MKPQSTILTSLTVILCLFFSTISFAQKTPVIKYFDPATTDQIQLDFDNDGDLDYIIAGVIADKHQGRVYLVENKGNKYAKPEYIYSFPSIPVKQVLEIDQQNHIVTINTTGTSPTGVERKYIGTLVKGQFEGMLAPPATFNPKK